MAMGTRFPALVDGRVNDESVSSVTTMNLAVATSGGTVADHIEDAALVKVSEYVTSTRNGI